MINNKRSYTEYNVTSPTTDFAIGFENYGFSDKGEIVVTLNGESVEALGYTVRLKNPMTIEVLPAISEGRVRLVRVTSVDTSFHKFTAGALFTAKSMDENFEQVRLSQQEVGDKFVYLADNTDSVLSAVRLTVAEAKQLIVDMQYFLAKGATIDGITVEMLPPEATPEVELGGTPNNRTFNLKIPRGLKGDYGDVDVATFEVDIQTGQLVMTTSVGYTGAVFAINDNNLEVTI